MTQESESTGDLFKVEKYYISNPLIAVIAVGEKGDGESEKAKKQDYFNTISVWNATYGYDVFYSRIKSDVNNVNDVNQDDEKSNGNGQDVKDVKYEERLVTSRLDINEIKKEKYQILWSKEEILSFLTRVNQLVLKKDSVYDSLIVVTCFFGFENLANDRMKSSDKEEDVLIKDLIDPFLKKNEGIGITKKKQLCVMIDRYYRVETKQLQQATDSNGKTQNHDFTGVDIYEQATGVQMYTHPGPYAMHDEISFLGGPLTQSFQSNPFKQFMIEVQKGQETDLRKLCSKYLGKYIAVELKHAGTPRIVSESSGCKHVFTKKK